jgi:hypothetical protein
LALFSSLQKVGCRTSNFIDFALKEGYKRLQLVGDKLVEIDSSID